MTRRFAALALAIVAMATAMSVCAQQVTPREIWPQAAVLAKDGELDAATKRAADLFNVTSKNYGIRSYPTYALAAASLARAAERDGAPDVVKWADAMADRLDSKSPAVAFSKADRAAAKNDWARAVPLAVTGLTRILTNYRAGVLTRADMVMVIALAVGVAAIIFAIALFIRYGRSMTHDFREMLGTRLRGGSVSVLAFALLFAPIFLWLGPMWLVFYWFVIFFAYASVTERIVVVLLAILVALIPVALDAAANWTAGVDSPVVMAALASSQQSYQPDALRRLQEVLAVAPENPTLHLLLGNLQTFEGNDEQAEVHYKKAIELKPTYAGAHVNLGNLYFMDNVFPKAISEYEAAERADPKLAIAFYNHSVAAGDTYKFDQQAAMLEQARRADRALVERLTRTPPALKVVMYHPAIEEAWRISEQVARNNQKEELALFANYSFFDPRTTILNPVSLGAIAAILLGIGLWLKRRRTGLAGACIKCGRTFCPRCKSARESATYCTQCIHIYLKRDGVSLDTKRHKLEEVTLHHTGMGRRNRLFATFLPGSAQMLEGRTWAGLVGILLFSVCIGVAILTGRLAPALGPSASVAQMLVRAIAILIAIIIWIMLSLPVYRRRATV